MLNSLLSLVTSQSKTVQDLLPHSYALLLKNCITNDEENLPSLLPLLTHHIKYAVSFKLCMYVCVIYMNFVGKQVSE